jgi:hypothetical protein
MVKSAEGECQCFLYTLLQKQHFLRMQESDTELEYHTLFCGKEREKDTPILIHKVNLYVYITCYMDCRY